MKRKFLNKNNILFFAAGTVIGGMIVSGIFFTVAKKYSEKTGKNTAPSVCNSCIEQKNNDTAGIYESYGRGWLVQIPDEKENILKPGDWNTLRIRVEGNHVQTWLNGEPMTDFEDEKIGAAQGRIALQIHDGGGIKVLWRNIKVTRI